MGWYVVSMMTLSCMEVPISAVAGFSKISVMLVHELRSSPLSAQHEGSCSSPIHSDPIHAEDEARSIRILVRRREEKTQVDMLRVPSLVTRRSYKITNLPRS